MIVEPIYQDRGTWSELKDKAQSLHIKVVVQMAEGKSYMDIPEWQDWVAVEWAFLQFRNNLYEEF